MKKVVYRYEVIQYRYVNRQSSREHIDKMHEEGWDAVKAYSVGYFYIVEYSRGMDESNFMQRLKEMIKQFIEMED